MWEKSRSPFTVVDPPRRLRRARSRRACAEPTAPLPDLSIVVPAFNEAGRIEGTMAALFGFLAAQHVRCEVIVVDDGSEDGTGEAVRRYQAAWPAIRLVRHRRNCGKGTALRTGVLHSRGARILLMDADLSAPLGELEKLSAVLDSGAAIALGSRALTAAEVRRSQPWYRALIGYFGKLWIRLIAVPGVRDTQCGFKLLEGELARQLFRRCREARFAIDVELLCRARWSFSARVEEVGICWEHRDGSRVRWQDYWLTFWAVPCIAWTVWRESNPAGSR